MIIIRISNIYIDRLIDFRYKLCICILLITENVMFNCQK